MTETSTSTTKMVRSSGTRPIRTYLDDSPIEDGTTTFGTPLADGRKENDTRPYALGSVDASSSALYGSGWNASLGKVHTSTKRYFPGNWCHFIPASLTPDKGRITINLVTLRTNEVKYGDRTVNPTIPACRPTPDATVDIATRYASKSGAPMRHEVVDGGTKLVYSNKSDAARKRGDAKRAAAAALAATVADLERLADIAHEDAAGVNG